MVTTYVEPPDGSIVGWGSPVLAVHVRIDEYAHPTPGPDEDERWFQADEVDDDPLCWESLCRSHRGDGVPYLLVPASLEVAP
jgi:hypothetical protein